MPRRSARFGSRPRPHRVSGLYSVPFRIVWIECVKKLEVLMSRRILVALTWALAMPAISAAQQGTALQSAVAALGATSLSSVQFTATGQAYVLGQPATAAEPWPVRPVKSFH